MEAFAQDLLAGLEFAPSVGVPDSDRVATRVAALAAKPRREEIARMLAGASVTDEARAAARRLLQGTSA